MAVTKWTWSLVLAALTLPLAACGEAKHQQTGDLHERTAAPSQAAASSTVSPDQAEPPAETWQAGMVKSQDLSTTTHNAPAGNAVAPKQGDAPIASLDDAKVALSAEVMTQQSLHSGSISKDQATDLAAKISAFIDAAATSDATKAAPAWNSIIATAVQIKLKHAGSQSSSLGLYDNTTIYGKALNAANSLVDIAAQLYGGVISLNFNQIIGAGQSAIRDLFDVFE